MQQAARKVARDETSIAGVILAGGTSRRMGREKSLLPFGGTTLLAQIADRLAPQVARLAISANGDARRFASCGLPVLPDPMANGGPLAGMLAGLRWAGEHGHTHLLTVACDTPFFPDTLATTLADAVGPDPARVALARSRGRDQYAFTLQPVGLARQLERRLAQGADRSIRGWLAQCAAVPVAFEAGEDWFLNINTAGDLAEAERRVPGPWRPPAPAPL